MQAGQITPEMVVNGWMNSEGHKRNILDSSFKSIGIGCVNVNGLYCWVQCFGRGSASEAKAGSYSNKTSTRKVLAAKGLVAQAASFKLADTKLKVGESTSFKTLWGGSELKNAGAVAVFLKHFCVYSKKWKNQSCWCWKNKDYYVF